MIKSIWVVLIDMMILIKSMWKMLNSSELAGIQELPLGWGVLQMWIYQISGAPGLAPQQEGEKGFWKLCIDMIPRYSRDHINVVKSVENYAGTGQQIGALYAQNLSHI